MGCASTKTQPEFPTTDVSNQATIYWFPMSQPSRAVALLCDMAKLNVEFKMVNIMKGEKCKANPLGSVPYLQDQQKDFSVNMGEGGAILIHLCETRNSQCKKYYPANPQIRSKIHYWMHWHHTGARNSSSKIMRDLFFPTTTKEQVVTDMKAFLPVLHYLDQSLKQQGTKFLACDNVTIADMFLLAEIDQLDPVIDATFSDGLFPNLENWRKSMSSLPSYAKNFAPIQGFHNSDMFKARTEWFKESIQETNLDEAVATMRKTMEATDDSSTNKDIDANGDGEISYEEYKQYLLRSQ